MSAAKSYFNIATVRLGWYFGFLFGLSFFTASIANADPKQLPKLPSSVVAPTAITLNCIDGAKTLPALDLCRANFETVREYAEEYNQRIKRFCNSLNNFDSQLRTKALAKKLSWKDYDEIKINILAELEECNPDIGDYYAPYRARMREYKQALKQHDVRREAIVNRMDI